MSSKNLATIRAFGSYLPERRLTNFDLEKLVDTSDEWILARTGIKERRIAAEDEYTSSMAAKSTKCALEKANIASSQVDAIIVTTMTPDYFCPSTAALVQHAIGAPQACAIDIQAACSGFLYGLSIAKAWIESGAFNTVVVVASEKNSAFIDYQDRNTCVLFGDGSGAAVVQKGGQGYQIHHVTLGADGENSSLFIIPAGGSRLPASAATNLERQHYMRMNGKEVFKHAVRRMETSAKECLDASGIAEESINWLIPHQANVRIMEAIAKRFNIPWERVVRTIESYANTSAATIPITICELEKRESINSGDTLLLTAFGGGLTWGSAVLIKADSAKENS